MLWNTLVTEYRLQRKGYPAAVLLRGTTEVSGPGRLTKRLGIEGGLNQKVASYEDGLWFEDNPRGEIVTETGPRIGVDYAGKNWAEKPYRFWFSKSKSGA